MRIEYSIRPAHEGDLRFIGHAWLTSYHRNNKYNRLLTSWNQYYASQSTAIFDLFSSGAQSLVAVNPEELNQIFAFIVFQDNLIHYIYTKTFYRHRGIASALLKATGWSPGMDIHCTHATDDAIRINNNKYPVILLRR